MTKFIYDMLYVNVFIKDYMENFTCNVKSHLKAKTKLLMRFPS